MLKFRSYFCFIYLWGCRYPYGPEEGTESTGAGVASGCELPHMCVGHQTWVPYLRSKCP